MEKSLVSVIITTYKRNDMLPRAIESVLNQTYKNIELIIVDDNDSGTIYRKQTEILVKSYMEKDERIKYVKLENNSGACIARNTGLKESSGEYINFLDDDDSLLPEKIDLQIHKFNNIDDNVGVVGCFANIFDNNGKLVCIDRKEIRGNVFFEELCHSFCSTPIALIKSDLIKQSGGWTTIPSSQEHLFFSKLFYVSPFYDYVNKPLVSIYHHSGNRISNNKNKPLGAIKLAEYFKENYYSSLTSKQIDSLELCMNANIINAYLLIGDNKTAIKYLKQRIKRIGKFDKVFLKTIVKLIVNQNILNYIRSILLNRIS